jgi:hypothetical protein
MKLSKAVATTAFVLFAGSALAQTTVIEERRGPGESVGSAVGGVVDSAVAVPGAVINWVTGQPRRSVRYERQVVVGEPLAREVEVTVVPDHDDYAYAVVNDRRVIVEPRTRRIVRIID